MFTHDELVIIDEIVGGRYDALKDILRETSVNRNEIQKDIKTIEPVVIKVRKLLKGPNPWE